MIANDTLLIARLADAIADLAVTQPEPGRDMWTVRWLLTDAGIPRPAHIATTAEWLATLVVAGARRRTVMVRPRDGRAGDAA